MTVYVFGAGASHHAGYPLAGELWNQLSAWVRGGGPECDPYRDGIAELNQLYGDLANFEEILTELDDCPPGSHAAALNKTYLGLLRSNVRNCLPEYFNTIRQRPALLYDQFARERVRAGDLIITFNYDLACEQALKTVGRWEISDGYGFQVATNVVPSSKVKVLKLHGSTDWVWLLFAGLKPGGFVQMYGDALSNRPVIRSYNDLE